MADYGAIFRANDGSLLVTSDTPCYELFGTFQPTGRDGNVNTYWVNSSVFPLISVNCGAGNSGGVLAVEGASGNWTVSVLSNVSCNILAFIPITGTVTAGYGIATYDSSGRLVFDSSRNILNARHINMLKEDWSFQSNINVNIVSFTSGAVLPSKTQSDEWVLIEAWGYAGVEYQCRYEMQYNCYQEDVFNCNNVYVCSPSYSCGIDYMGNYSCSYVDNCGYELVCGYETQTVCRTEYIQICEFVNVTNYASISGLVRTTSWIIYRGVAAIGNAGNITFNWLQHLSGNYKEILEYFTDSYSSATVNGLPSGYIPPPIFISVSEASIGELNKNNTFPYTENRANNSAMPCITLVRSDYE